MHVRAGARVPMLDVEGTDSLLSFLCAVLDTMLDASPRQRPTMLDVNSKFAYFIRVMLLGE